MSGYQLQRVLVPNARYRLSLRMGVPIANVLGRPAAPSIYLGKPKNLPIMVRFEAQPVVGSIRAGSDQIGYDKVPELVQRDGEVAHQYPAGFEGRAKLRLGEDLCTDTPAQPHSR